MVLRLQVMSGAQRQRIDGFGCCLAFARARLLHRGEGLPPAAGREVLDHLFDTSRGIGLSILRIGIGPGAGGAGRMRSLTPESSGRPDAPLTYDWDGDDSGQVWLAQEAWRYGVRRFYANAWSAPGGMLDSDTETAGGVVRGMPGADPSLGDWRQAYADYLLQYVRFYRRHGVEITDIGFVNEPDLLINQPSKVMPYPQMRLEPYQVTDFIKVMGPAIERSGLPLSLVACDAMMWTQQARYTAAIEADPEAARWVGVHAGHNYVQSARWPLPTSRPTWMSEWDPDVENHTGPWHAAWDSGHRSDGIALAEDVHDALTMAQVSGYVYWFGASTRGTRALVQVDGAEYRISSRLWALGTYSRFVRPGAVRFDVSTSPAVATVKSSAFRNTDGSTVIVVLNLATTATEVVLGVAPQQRPVLVERWLTDREHSLQRVAAHPADAERVTVCLPARSLTAVVVRLLAASPEGNRQRAELTVSERIPVAFEGDGAGVEELSWGQWELWEGMDRLGTWMPMGLVKPVPTGATVDSVAAQLRFLMSRYQTMRTRLRFDPDGPKQVLAAAGETVLEVVDAGEEDDPARIAFEVERRLQETPFDFTTDWPVRMAVVRHRGTPTHQVTVLCHLVTDAGGGAVIEADLAARAAGVPLPPPPETQPFTQARWQRSPAGQRHCHAALRFWERQLRRIPARRFAESADPRTPRYWRVGFTSRATHLALRAIAAAAGMDAASVLPAVYSVALARVTGINQVATRIIVNNRFRPGLANVVGPLAQTGLLVVDVAEITFAEALSRTRSGALVAYKYAYHDASRLYELVERIGRERGEEIHIGCFFNDRRAAGRSPAPTGLPEPSVPTMAEIRAALAETSLRWEHQQDEPYEELFFHVKNVPDTVDAAIEADTHCLAPEDIARLVREVEAVAVAAAGDLETPTGVAGAGSHAPKDRP